MKGCPEKKTVNDIGKTKSAVRHTVRVPYVRTENGGRSYGHSLQWFTFFTGVFSLFLRFFSWPAVC